MIDKIIELYIENVDFHLENSTSRVEIGLQLKLQFQDTLKLVEYNYFMYTIQRQILHMTQTRLLQNENDPNYIAIISYMVCLSNKLVIVFTISDNCFIFFVFFLFFWCCCCCCIQNTVHYPSCMASTTFVMQFFFSMCFGEGFVMAQIYIERQKVVNKSLSTIKYY